MKTSSQTVICIQKTAWWVLLGWSISNHRLFLWIWLATAWIMIMNERTLSPSLTELQPLHQISGECFEKTQHYSETNWGLSRHTCFLCSVVCGTGRVLWHGEDIVHNFLFTFKKLGMCHPITSWLQPFVQLWFSVIILRGEGYMSLWL